MRVGVVMSGFSPECGGAHTFECELLEALTRIAPESRHQFQVFACRQPQIDVSSDAVQIVSISKRQRFVARARTELGRLLGPLTKRGRRARRLRYRSLWLEPFLVNSGVDMAWFLAPSVTPLDLPYITIVWDLQHRLQPYFPEVSHNLEFEAREEAFATTLQRASRVIAGTTVGQAEIERFYQLPPDRIRILPHPTPQFALAPPPIDDAAVLQRFGLSPGYLFYPAQFWPHKNHAGLLQALRVLQDEHGIRMSLAFAGSDQGNRSHIERLAEDWGLRSQTRFLGFVTREELIALYRQAFALTYTTFFGPENLPPLEAFALGCPVIASRVAGAEEQFGDAALLADPSDPVAIADAVRLLVRDSELRRELIARGRQRAVQFTSDDFVRGVVRILDEFEVVRQCWESKSARGTAA